MTDASRRRGEEVAPHTVTGWREAIDLAASWND